MAWYNRVLEYIFYTGFMTLAYYPVVIPWLLFIVHVSPGQTLQYLWQGFLIDLMVAYPIGKLLIRLSPTIKRVTGIDLQLLWRKINDLYRCRWQKLRANLEKL